MIIEERSCCFYYSSLDKNWRERSYTISSKESTNILRAQDFHKQIVGIGADIPTMKRNTGNCEKGVLKTIICHRPVLHVDRRS